MSNTSTAAAGWRYEALTEEERQVVTTLRRDGVAILHGLLSAAELTAARREFDALQQAAGAGGDDAPGNAGKRTVLCTCQHVPVGRTQALGRLAAHPRVVAIAEALLDDDAFVDLVRTNRYLPGHPGMAGHSDGTWTTPYSTIATQIFLDDIDAQSGALTYMPGTHTQYFLHQTDGSTHPAPLPQPPFGDDPVIQAAAARFTAVELSAGSVTFRVGQVWHGVKPVHRLRRSLCTSYSARHDGQHRPHVSIQVGTVSTVEEARAWRVRHCETLVPGLQKLFAENDDIVRTKEELLRRQKRQLQPLPPARL